MWTQSRTLPYFAYSRNVLLGIFSSYIRSYILQTAISFDIRAASRISGILSTIHKQLISKELTNENNPQKTDKKLRET